MKARYRRLEFIACGVAIACAFVLNAFRANVMFFVRPGEIASRGLSAGERFRLGGLAERGSVVREADGRTVRFIVVDERALIPVVYTGALPNLFREDAGVVADGALAANGVLHADEVLAKHGEEYKPLGAPTCHTRVTIARADVDACATGAAR
ncbi:Cytochrome c-type biogeneis protein CcmE, heme chaperone [Candidatus Burkholderia humilis]|nr:Cytochrome c-type biogeneis protein CcmE, heme chaperone [Candidatus Burkholderia humilis]